MTASRFPVRGRVSIAILLAGLLGGSTLHGQWTADEAHTLAAGWNAIWLELTPLATTGEPVSAEDLFAAIPEITKVTTPDIPISNEEFLSDLSETSFNQDEWQTWRRDDTAGEHTLGTVRGGRPYLVYATSTTTLAITGGTAAFHRPRWRARAYNLRGFRLDPAGTLTFSELFEPVADIFPVNQIFKLAPGGSWLGVSGSEAVKSGVAYWIRCEGATDFMAPVHLNLGEGEQISFGSGPGATPVFYPESSTDPLDCSDEQLQFVNRSSLEQNVSIVREDAEDELQLFETIVAQDELKFVGAPIAISGGTVNILGIGGAVGDESAGVSYLRLAARRAWTSTPTNRKALLSVNLGGVLYYVPISASSTAVEITEEGSGDSTYAGLWVGVASIGRVTSLAEDTRPVSETSSSIPLTLIVHVEETGAAVLLSEVVVMQTRPTEDEAEAEPILVINDERIPFFDGIEERGGKLVGLRIQSVGYDMPRKMDPATQATLQASIYNADSSSFPGGQDDVTEAVMEAYVAGRGVRPSTLAEEYFTKWPLGGSFAPGMSLQSSSPLTLDPFHRTNPFRHAFAPKHTAGFQISRMLYLTFDDAESGADRLTGLFREEISGLAHPSVAVASGNQSANKVITSQGPVVFHRVSSARTLEQ